MLKNRFSGAEGAGSTEGSSESHGEKGVDDPQLSRERLFRQQFFPVIGNGDLHRPFLSHGNLAAGPLFIYGNSDFVINGIFSGSRHRFESPTAVPGKGDHYVVGDDTFRNRTDPVAGVEYITGLGDRSPLPFAFFVEGPQIYSAFQKESGAFGQQLQGIL